MAGTSHFPSSNFNFSKNTFVNPFGSPEIRAYQITYLSFLIKESLNPFLE